MLSELESAAGASAAASSSNDGAASTAQAALQAIRNQPLARSERAIEGFRIAASAAAPAVGAQAQAVADTGANARTALQRGDLALAQSAQVQQVLERLGNALVDGKLDPHLDAGVGQHVYDLATADAGSGRFDDALAQLTTAAQPFDGNTLDDQSDQFAQVRQTAQDYAASSNIALSASQRTYVDQSLQVAVSHGHVPSRDEVHDLVDKVADTPFPKFAANVCPASISLKSLARLNTVADAAKIDVGKLVVTSSARTPAQQAVIMYDQLQDGTISHYGPAGQQVIAVYNQGIAHHDSPDTIRDAMRDKMADLLKQGIPVSNHFVDLDKMNVFDIGPAASGMSAAQKQHFQSALVQAKSDGTITNFLSPFTGHDPAFHIEIKQ